MDVTYLKPWLVLSHMPGMNSRLFNKLLLHFQTPEQVLTCCQQTLEAIGVRSPLRSAILQYQAGKLDNKKVEQTLVWLEHEQHTICTLACTGYPSLLKQIPDPPPLLYVSGLQKNITFPQIAMVGSRNPSPGGRRNARDFARQLSECGYSICSGMAQGIDYESHMGALESGGSTLAVLGTGIDQVYPAQHRKLAGKIIEQGALISEFPLGMHPAPRHFPQRNRIVSGLSHGVLVVEGALRSGSLISARFALEQGREVFAIPGSIHNPNARGCHHLISEGAKLVESIEDILEELGSFARLENLQANGPGQAETRASASSIGGVQLSISCRARALLAAVDYEATSPDSLVASTGLGISEIAILITELELAGLIESVAGGYVLIPKK